MKEPPRPKGLPGLNAARRARFLSQKELGQLSGFNEASISLLECGHRDAYLTTIRRLAEVLQVAPEALLTAPGKSAAAIPAPRGARPRKKVTNRKK